MQKGPITIGTISNQNQFNREVTGYAFNSNEVRREATAKPSTAVIQRSFPYTDISGLKQKHFQNLPLAKPKDDDIIYIYSDGETFEEKARRNVVQKNEEELKRQRQMKVDQNSLLRNKFLSFPFITFGAKDIIKIYGDYELNYMYVYRQNYPQSIDKAMKLLQNRGQFDQITHDQLFKLYMKIKLTPNPILHHPSSRSVYMLLSVENDSVDLRITTMGTMDDTDNVSLIHSIDATVGGENGIPQRNLMEFLEIVTTIQDKRVINSQSLMIGVLHYIDKKPHVKQLVSFISKPLYKTIYEFQQIIVESIQRLLPRLDKVSFNRDKKEK